MSTFKNRFNSKNSINNAYKIIRDTENAVEQGFVSPEILEALNFYHQKEEERFVNNGWCHPNYESKNKYKNLTFLRLTNYLISVVIFLLMIIILIDIIFFI